MCVSCKDGPGTFLFTRVMLLLPRYKESWRLIIYRKYHIKSFLFPVRVVTSSFYVPPLIITLQYQIRFYDERFARLPFVETENIFTIVDYHL
jgi:hypothetical protein